MTSIIIIDEAADVTDVMWEYLMKKVVVRGITADRITANFTYYPSEELNKTFPNEEVEVTDRQMVEIVSKLGRRQVMSVSHTGPISQLGNHPDPGNTVCR